MADQPGTYRAPYFTDSVGRPRKLSAGAMSAICAAYAKGAASQDLAKEYGVSRSLILTVVYHTARTR